MNRPFIAVFRTPASVFARAFASPQEFESYVAEVRPGLRGYLLFDAQGELLRAEGKAVSLEIVRLNPTAAGH